MRKLFNKKKNICLFVMFALISFYSCNEYLDVNTDEDAPVEVAPNLILPNLQISVGQIGDARSFTAEILSVYMHQLVSRSEQDQYGAQPDNTSMGNDWNNIYLVLTDIQTLIDQSAESGDRVYLGIAQALRAYLGSVAVDLWGDAPFSEATQLNQGITSPVFDDDMAIYQEVFNLLDMARANIASGEGALTPGNDDLFYGGDTESWVRFVNTLEFKLLNQIRLSSMFNQGDLDALVAEDNFMMNLDDDFQFNHFGAVAPSDERNQLFRASFISAQVDHYVSPWFYEIMMGFNPNIFNGLEDPRIPYYWVNQLAPGEFPTDQGDMETGDPNADYWDRTTGFFSIRFGSTGPDRDHAVQNDATFPGIYPSGGRFDDGGGFSRSATTNGTGIAPKRILTYDEYLYTRAELIQAGLLNGDAAMVLEDAITASFAKVDDVVSNNGSSQMIPVLSGTMPVADYIEGVIAEFNAADDAKKLEIIMTQKWIATFGDPVDQYTDFRRTGFPILANPNGPSPEYQLDNMDGFPLNDAQTTASNSFPASLFWPSSEIDANANAPAQKNIETYRIFWDN